MTGSHILKNQSGYCVGTSRKGNKRWRWLGLGDSSGGGWYFPGDSVVKSLPAMQETWVWFPGSGRSPGRGNGNPCQYSWLGNPIRYQRVRHDWAHMQISSGDAKRWQNSGCAFKVEQIIVLFQWMSRMMQIFLAWVTGLMSNGVWSRFGITWKAHCQ